MSLARIFVIFHLFAAETAYMAMVKDHSRNSRAVLFPASSTVGIFIALAIPIDLPNRNVFLSFNFEANYNLAYEGWHYFPGPFQRLQFEFESEAAAMGYDTETEARNSKSDKNSTVPLIKKKKSKKVKKVNKETTEPKVDTKRSVPVPLISRRHIYKILIDKFKHSGFKGKPCLLRTICEVNSFDMGTHNGVFGDILHIIFKPTSSEDEQLSDDFYIAEFNGLAGHCNMYNKRCPKSVLELISKEYFLKSIEEELTDGFNDL